MAVISRRAYGLARISVRKAELRRVARVGRLAMPFALEQPLDPVVAFEELLAVYATALAGYRELEPLLSALLARHELANVLTVIRERLNAFSVAGATLWRPLGALEQVREATARACGDMQEIAALLARTRLRGVAPMLQDMAPNALGPTSLAAERLVWAGIDRAFAALPSGERAAKAIGALLVIEQDLDWVRRAPAAAGLDPLAATRATIRLRHIVRARHLERLAASTQDAGPLANALPEAWTWARHVTDWDELTFAARRRRRVLCERAFVGDPFVLAVPIAVVLFKEEELRALSAAREAGETRTPALDRAQAGSLVGVA